MGRRTPTIQRTCCGWDPPALRQPAPISIDLVIFNQEPLIQHTVTLNLVSDSGILLGTDSTTFRVAKMYGCGTEPECGGNGVCFKTNIGEYCVCYDSYGGEDCTQAVDDDAPLNTNPAAALTQSSTSSAAFSPLAAYRTSIIKKAQLNLQENTEKKELKIASAQVNIERENARIATSATALKTKLASHQVSTATTLATDKARVAALTTELHRNQERKFVRLEQARQEAERTKVENIEANLDNRQALMAHQQQINNRAMTTFGLR